MVARIWSGRTTKENYQAYSDFLIDVAVPDYKRINGCIELTFLKAITDDGLGHFKLISLWDNIESIKEFAGSDIHKAKFYTEDEFFLIEKDEFVEHFEVFEPSSITTACFKSDIINK